MSGVSKKLVFEYLDLMYNGPSIRRMHTYTSVPTTVLYIGKDPIIEVSYPYKTIIETKLNFGNVRPDYQLTKDFQKSMLLIFGSVPNLKEIVIEWLIKKEGHL